MNVAEKVKKALSSPSNTPSERPDIKRVNEKLENLKKTGVLKKKEYSLPSQDAVGRQILRNAYKSGE